MIDSAGVRAVLPHREPMLLVHSVDDLADGDWIKSRFTVSAEEPWFAMEGTEAEPVGDAFPLPLMLESWGQSAGILAAKDSPNPDVLAGTVMLFGGASNVEFHRPVRPGETMEHRVRFTRVMEDSIVAEGETVIGDETVMTIGQIIMMFRPAAVLRSSETTEEN